MDDLDQIQGAVLRQIIVGANSAVRLAPYERAGRINTFVVNETVGVYVKHSGARMPPWSFTFHQEHIDELTAVAERHPNSFVVLVCGADGCVTLSASELMSLVSFEDTDQAWVRVNRHRRSMYGIAGNCAQLPYKVPRGVSPVTSAAENDFSP